MTITRIKQRRGTAAAWTAANPTLDSAEFGVETDTGKIKLGDGSTAWTALNYLLEDAALEGTPTAPTAAPGTDTTQIATTAFVGTAVDNATYAPDLGVFGVSPASGRYFYLNSITPVSGGQVYTNGRIIAHPLMVAKTTTLDRIAVQITTAGNAGAKLRFAIYDSGSDGLPASVVLQAGTVAADALGIVEAAISQQFTSGRYWLAECVQANGATQVQAYGVLDGFVAGVPAGTNFVLNASGPVATAESSYSSDAALPGTFPSLGVTARRRTHIAVRAA